MLEKVIENPKVRTEFGATIEKIEQGHGKRQVVEIKGKEGEDEWTRTCEADLVSQTFHPVLQCLVVHCLTIEAHETRLWAPMGSDLALRP